MTNAPAATADTIFAAVCLITVIITAILAQQDDRLWLLGAGFLLGAAFGALMNRRQW